MIIKLENQGITKLDCKTFSYIVYTDEVAEGMKSISTKSKEFIPFSKGTGQQKNNCLGGIFH